MYKLFIILSLLLCSCVGKPIVTPPPAEVRERENKRIRESILVLGKNGDWLATRGYKSGDQLVVHATHTPISHAAVLDMDNLQVVEAEGKGVHLTGLDDFIDKSHRVILMRPIWAKDDHGDKALAEAITLVGKKYDLMGILGLNTKDAYYCSELCLYIYRKHHEEKNNLPKVIEPGQLYLWADILFDSRPKS